MKPRYSKFIYFIQNRHTGNIKIGQSNEPIKRLQALQTAVAEDLELVVVLPQSSSLSEWMLHSKYAEDRISGEWFSPNVYQNFISEMFLKALETVQPKPGKFIFRESILSSSEFCRRFGLGSGSEAQKLRKHLGNKVFRIGKKYFVAETDAVAWIEGIKAEAETKRRMPPSGSKEQSAKVF